MPHAFLMDEDTMTQSDGYLLRCRLHIRGGKSLIENNYTGHGIATLYDAIEYGMRWYYICNYSNRDDQILNDNQHLAKFLLQNGVISPNFDFLTLETLMERSLEDQDDLMIKHLDIENFWQNIAEFLTALRVLPFDDSDLPKENDKTKKLLGLS